MSEKETQDFYDGNNPDSPLIDSLGAAVKSLIEKGKERGYITMEELNKVLPPEKESSEQIEDILSGISDMGISIISESETDSFDAEEDSEEESADYDADESGNFDEKDMGRSDDPVRMYLKEMGTVELLSREGEIAILRVVEHRHEQLGGLIQSVHIYKHISLSAYEEVLKSVKLLRQAAVLAILLTNLLQIVEHSLYERKGTIVVTVGQTVDVFLCIVHPIDAQRKGQIIIGLGILTQSCMTEPHHVAHLKEAVTLHSRQFCHMTMQISEGVTQPLQGLQPSAGHEESASLIQAQGHRAVGAVGYDALIGCHLFYLTLFQFGLSLFTDILKLRKPPAIRLHIKADESRPRLRHITLASDRRTRTHPYRQQSGRDTIV